MIERTNEPQAIRIGSRGSALALAQTEIVRQALAEAGLSSEVVIITTQGDLRPPDTAWGEGAFVGAIEAALLSGAIDVGVHSAKDLPTDETAGLEIVAYLPRAAAGDVVVLPSGRPPISSLGDIPRGARIGTDSPRRTAFVKATRPDLAFHNLSGNVDTRLRKLDEGQSDALILAEAGLTRLGRGDRISLSLPPDLLPPAPGQGALAVQARADDIVTRTMVAKLDDAPTRVAVELERELLAATGGGCRAPIGALARVEGDRIDVTVGFARPDGSAAVILERSIPARDAGRDPDARATVVQSLLAALIERGAADASAAGGPTALVTRPANQAIPLALALLDHGIAPAVVPAIQIVAGDEGVLADAARRLHEFDWVVVTSANAAEALARAIPGRAAAGSAPRPAYGAQQPADPDASGPRFAAVGAATARTLRRNEIPVAFRPARATAESLGETLPLIAGERVLVPRSDIADARLIERLQQRGAAVEAIVAYRTVEAPAGSVPLLKAALTRSPAMIVMTSGSGARGLRALAEQLGRSEEVRELPVVCAGPETAREAERVGFRVAAIADRPDARTIAELVVTTLAQPRVPPAALTAGGTR